MEHFGINADRCLEECPHGSPLGCHERDMPLAEPLAGVRGPIQNSGLGGTPKPLTSPKSITRCLPSGGAQRVKRGAGGHVSAALLANDADLGDGPDAPA